MLSQIDMSKVTYAKLNNEVNVPKNGRIQLEKDQEATEAFLKENVIPNLIRKNSYKELVEYYLELDFVDSEMIKKYSWSDIEDLFKLAYSYNFKFQSFMSIFKFYNQYAGRTDDREFYIETFEDRVVLNAMYYAQGDVQFAKDLIDVMMRQSFQPATPSFMNAGRSRRGELVSCFILQVTDDMNSIGRTINSALQLSKSGGGVGITLTNLRESGSSIKGIKNASSGVVPVMKLLEDSFSYANQLGQRNGAGVAYLNVFHPDILKFLSTKKENADEKIRVKTLSLGLLVPDKFYELTKKNEKMFTFSPLDVEREYDRPFSYVNITEEYDNMVANPHIKKYEINPRNLEEEISKLQQESGYPYVINIDVANRANPSGGTIVSSNLCSEILQAQTPSQLNDKQEYTQLGTDVSCNLGSVNIVNLMKSGKNFGTDIDTMVRALTFVSNNTHIDRVPSVEKGNDDAHAIGLGAMGLATYYAVNKIHYGSEESIQFADLFFKVMNYYSLLASNKIAKERNESFVGFENSKYADGSYFDEYVNEKPDYADQVLQLFDGIHIPTSQDWAQLRDSVKKFGVYNKYRHAIAPTGSISYVNNTSASLLPIVNKVEARQEGLVGKVYYPAAGLSNETIPYFTSAYDIDMRRVIDIYAAAQKHIDQGMALTLFMRSTLDTKLYEWKDDDKPEMTTRDLTILRHYGFRKNLKSIYYIRTYTDSGEEAGANECESCSI